MTSIKLPIVYPPITSYPEIANIFSILFNHETEILPWISDRFFQVIIREKKEMAVVDFYDHADIDNYFSLICGCPFIDWMRLNRSVIRGKSFLKYLDFCLGKGYYVEPCLDRFYFSFAEEYNKEHFIHTALLSEVDYENQRVRLHDFINLKRYTDYWVDFDSLERSMNNDYLINLYRYQEANYEWNQELLKCQIKDFMDAKDSLRYFDFSYQRYNKIGILYGIAVYDYLIESFKKGNGSFDCKPVHVLYDRQELMTKRLEYLLSKKMFDSSNLNDIERDSIEIKDRLLIVRNMIIKHNLLHDTEIITKVCEKLKYIQQKELSMSEKLYNIIK